MHLRQPLLATTLLMGLTGHALADVRVYYRAGGWGTFDGKSDNGQPLCGIGSRNPVDGRTFSLRYEIGSNEVTFTASKPNWNIPDGTQLPVVIQIGLERPWSEQASGRGQRVVWTIDRESARIFDAQFRRSASMSVTFPSGNEQPWIISLAGSTAVSNAMRRCVTDLTRRAVGQQTAPPARPAQEPTQPFGAPPSAPSPQSVQPATPNNGTQAVPLSPAPQEPVNPAQPTQPNATH